MKAQTDHLLGDELERLSVEARSFVGESTAIPLLMDKFVEYLLDSAMGAGPGQARDVLIERANGIRMMADKLSQKQIQDVMPRQF